MPVIPVVGKLRKETFSKLEASLGYIDTDRGPVDDLLDWGLGNVYLQRSSVSMETLPFRETEGALPAVCPRPGDLWSLSLPWCLWRQWAPALSTPCPLSLLLRAAPPGDCFQALSGGSGLLCCCVWVAEDQGGRHLPAPKIIQLQMR